MNVLIVGGFWAIAKFMVLLCGTVILIIKSIYVYQKKYQKWKFFTRIFACHSIDNSMISYYYTLV